jgi:penicillin-binding protein 2
MDFDQEITQNLSPRARFLYCFLLVGFIIILGRLWELQVLRGDYFFDLSENNRMKMQEIPAPRGCVYDRQGRILVSNLPSFDISLLREGSRSLTPLLPCLSKVLNMEEEGIVQAVGKPISFSPFKPIKLKVDASRRELSLVEFYKLDLPNVMVEVVPKRNYPWGMVGAHLLGYLGEASQSELSLPEYAHYGLGDFLGKSGVEKTFEPDLRGQSGWLQFEVDARGTRNKALRSRDPVPGASLYLTIDLDLQCLAEKALGERAGAVIAMDPTSGEILALVSHPGFDPNLFSRGISPKNWRGLAFDPLHPLTNKALQGTYPPGSIFKIITALAGLEEKKITPETIVYCNGFYQFGDRPFRCWKKGGHGSMDLYSALEQSCDCYFYRIGQLVGVDALAHYATQFGLGRATGCVIGNEKSGLIPTSTWKKKTLRAPWHGGETLSTAIGQSFALVTPLQAAVLISAVANGGKVCKPLLVKKIVRPDGKIEEPDRGVEARAAVSSVSLGVIREGLRRVVEGGAGTGKIARIEGIEMAGKTGTAQVVALPPSERKIKLPPHLQDHAWFVAFAPFTQPQIAVAVLVEHGGFGSTTGGPIAKELIAYYLRQQLPLAAESLK